MCPLVWQSQGGVMRLKPSIYTIGPRPLRDHALRLPLSNRPAEKPFPVLIYGGSTATGIYGIQCAKLSELPVTTALPPHSFELMRSLGADHVFDYKSPDFGAKIRALMGNQLKHAWDCTGLGSAIYAAALSDNNNNNNNDGDRPKYLRDNHTRRSRGNRARQPDPDRRRPACHTCLLCRRRGLRMVRARLQAGH
ncbi:hypothetical protein GGR50DRAFT_678796 [Xylaria sp. CBS 124048]|nr:hypothetical protein GGR50DRAFT_678796 [Xylaria sp. CBS 124048]